MQLHGNLGGAELLQRFGELCVPAIDLDSGLDAHGIDDVGRRHRAEKSPALAGAGAHLDAAPGELISNALRRFAVARFGAAAQPRWLSAGLGTALIVAGVMVNLLSRQRYVHLTPSRNAAALALFVALVGVALAYLTWA